jgi:hypothetical protein
MVALGLEFLGLGEGTRVFSKVTLRIISPPPCQGGIADSSSWRR